MTPEALDGGPIALVEEGDLIEINIPERRLAVVGVARRRLTAGRGRRACWRSAAGAGVRRRRGTRSGILSLYSRVASGSDVGRR